MEEYKTSEGEKENLFNIQPKEDSPDTNVQELLNCIENLYQANQSLLELVENLEGDSQKLLEFINLVEIHNCLRNLTSALGKLDQSQDDTFDQEYVINSTVELTTSIFQALSQIFVQITPEMDKFHDIVQLFSDIIHSYCVILDVLKPENLELPFFLENHVIDAISQIVNFEIRDKNLKDIIQFLNIIFNQTLDCIVLILTILKTSQLKKYILADNLKESYGYIVQLLFDISKVFTRNMLNENPEIDFEKDFFELSILFLNIGNLESQKQAYGILINLITVNEKASLEFIRNSDELIEIVTRQLVIDNPSEDILIKTIQLVGVMCQQNYHLDRYPLQALIQCLDHDNPKVKMMTAYALCNALTETNREQFTPDDAVEIFHKLANILDNDIFDVILYISNIIPKIILGCLDPSIYPSLVENNIFETFARMACIEDYMNSSQVEHFLNVIDQMFQMADSNQLIGFFMEKFEESECYEIISNFEFNDETIQQRVNAFFAKYNEVRAKM